jgi:eukaryotic-like serine/threonine-protein kinase
MTDPTRQSSENSESGPESTVTSAFCPNDDQPALDGLASSVIEEMVEAWRDGASSPAEAWLERHPKLASKPEAAVRLIFEEICLREERGEQVASTEIFTRFPQWKHELEVLLDCHRLMESEPAAVVFPEAGAQLGELRLLRELGRGGQGRVFLATQPSLSDRPLVVKITPRSGDEHLSLARLQHTHIVPLYLVQDFPANNLRALCMPYVGGTSWSHVLQALRTLPPDRRRGRDLVQILESDQDDPRLVVRGPAVNFLMRATYIEAISWIGSCLADALHYAHERGLIHLDIKPSNVLLAGDGQPMLLDFHLARELVAAGGTVDRLGGTRGYMSHEQELDAAAVRAGQRVPCALDGRSDIYSLGVLLYESLAGRLPQPDERASRHALRRANADVSRGLEDILHKCLAEKPEDRYADAGQLAADLRRHLASLPLEGVPNHSLSERWQKWRRRRPYALGLAAAALLVAAVVVGTGMLVHRDRLASAHTALVQSQQDFEGRNYSSAIANSELGLKAIRWLPGQDQLRQSLHSALERAKRAQRADALHKLVQQLRYVDNSDDVPSARLGALDAGCRKIWEARRQIVVNDVASDAPLDEALRTDMLDLALLGSRLRMRLAADNQYERARQEALETLDEAAELCGPNPVLDLANRVYSGVDAVEDNEAGSVAQSAWEHYAVGRLLLHSNQTARAKAEFERAIEREPDFFWANFGLAQCAYRLEEFEAALNSASVCVALAPNSFECFYNRALCYQALGRMQPAITDFTRALKLEPNSGTAMLHRGVALAQAHRAAEALDDLTASLTHDARRAEVYYEMARVHLDERDLVSARACVEEALEDDPAYEPALALRRKLAERQ